MINLKLIAKQFILNIQFLFKNKKLLLLFMMPIALSALILVVFVPTFQGFPISLEISLIPILGFIFASISFNFTKSTLYQNLKVTKSNKYNFNITILLIMIVSSIFILFILLSILSILSELHILETRWLEYDYNSRYYSFFNDALWIAILSSIEISVILFSISFFYTRIFNSEKSYYILILAITIFAIFFGGTFNNYFWSWGGEYMRFHRSMFPLNTFTASLFFPFYAPGQLSVFFGQHSFRWVDGSFGVQGDWANISAIKWQSKSFSVIPESYYGEMWKWNTVLLMPLIQSIFFGLLGILSSKKKSN